MRLNQFDLNLLVALGALLEERSVTRAAERLNLSQPAMSAALRRLREAFKDELLVMHGKRMVPTAHAQHLAPQVAQAIVTMRSLLSSSTQFDPATSHRAFRIAASDYVTMVVIVPMLAELARIAPNVRVEILPPQGGVELEMERGTVDLLISPEQFQGRGHPQDLLFEERHVVLGWAENPLLCEPMSEQDYDDASHVIVEVSRTLSFAEEHVRARGDRRRIVIVASSFTVVPWMLPGTQRIALVHERLARAFLPHLPLAIVQPPFAIPPMREMMQYHRTRAQDGGLTWLRELLRRHGHAAADGASLPSPPIKPEV